ncbi:PucR family transcriptional regulator [Rhizohabitans arisaemae]|uniref:PucR family transcriptional regulator n=1 Tax=Rhizohabitans arisaemae TaxID=2720610 RepID=UPI0024B27ADB|nr:helix-turn-helix domain-containing protein [Rhizohabitans arisaemae]
MSTTVTVRDLLADDSLRAGELLGGASGLDSAVREVILVTGGRELDSAPPGAAAVLDLTGAGGLTHTEHLVELVCRRLRGRSGRLLVVAGGRAHAAMSTGRLADRLGLPVLTVAEGLSPPVLACRLLALVRRPEITLARTLNLATRRLHAAAGDLTRILAAVDVSLRGRTALVTSGGSAIAGPAPECGHLLAEASAEFAERAGSLNVAACPAGDLWVVCEAAAGGPLWRDAALAVLRPASAYVTAWLAGERLAAERDARRRSQVLAELLHVEGEVPIYLNEQAAKLGWRLEGWHSGIHIAVVGEAGHPPTVTERLTGELAAHGVAGPVAELAGGWSTWVTSPSPAWGRELPAAVRSALASFRRGGNRPVLVAGIGQPAQGPRGISSTLAEARQAAVVSASSGEPGTVKHVDELGAKRLLLGWYGSAAFRDYARQILDPLLGEPGLLRTIEVYLDCGCSPSEAAQRLGLHRNTVSQRVRRAESLLGTALATPDDRLALQLACRAIRVG